MDTSCGIFLINSKNELLLGHAINAPFNMWSIPKGLIEKGETYMEAAIRETFEETNVKIDLNSNKITQILEFEMIKYQKTKKQLKSYAIFTNEDFSKVELKCTSTFINRRGDKVPENDKVMWVPLYFKDDPKYSYIQLHDTQETLLKYLIEKLSE
jgi:ADP-ribose pyrophosphatase YjhB (NUDIX family)